MNIAYIKSNIARLNLELIEWEKGYKQRISEEGIDSITLGMLIPALLEERNAITQQLRYWEHQLAETGEGNSTGKKINVESKSMRDRIHWTIQEEVQRFAHPAQVNTTVPLPIRFSMSKQQPFSQAVNDDSAASSLSVPELRFVECEDNYTRIYANAAEIGSMQEESDNSFFIELFFLGSHMAPTIKGTTATAKEWVYSKWQEFYRAIHTLPEVE